MKILFKDHFSDNSERYNLYRPEYPPGLFEYLSSISPSKEKAWDCATGTGQSARNLKKYFSVVIATDASTSQIKNAKSEKGITYLVAPAEYTGIDSHSIDLVTVAQALHWFNIVAFFNEADRVLKPNGILAVWTYNLLNIRPDIDKAINRLYGLVLDKYWPGERRMVDDGYGSIKFPFKEIQSPEFEMIGEWNLNQLVGYISTWSAVSKYRNENGIDPVNKLQEELSNMWGNPENKLTVKWPLTVIVRMKNR